MGTRYRVVADHVELVPNPDFKPNRPDTHPAMIEKLVRAGEVFETDRDMLRFNGPPPMSPKFTLAEDLRMPSTAEELDKRIAEFEAEKARILAQQPKQTPVQQAAAQGAAELKAPAKPARTEAQLKGMNEKQLRELAADEEIDVAHCKGKDDLVKAIFMAK